MEEILASGYPLIFNALDYMNRPIGFVCYHFDDYVITNYSRTSGITSAISLGVGGYVNQAYQEDLLHRMEEMYKRDALTGLYNRIAFQNIFKEIRYNRDNHNKPITVIMSDLDGLKYINDHFGHADGDNAIAMVAKALEGFCPEDAVCSRFGGDEVFCVIIGECNAEAIINRINKVLDDYNRSSGLSYFVTTSSGAYTTSLDDDFDILQALKIADEKMYEVKRTKNYVR
jgi:diguanylate cyclase (GGDEF)-like protein